MWVAWPGASDAPECQSQQLVSTGLGSEDISPGKEMWPRAESCPHRLGDHGLFCRLGILGTPGFNACG